MVVGESSNVRVSASESTLLVQTVGAVVARHRRARYPRRLCDLTQTADLPSSPRESRAISITDDSGQIDPSLGDRLSALSDIHDSDGAW